jgi:hypothetical protein
MSEYTNSAFDDRHARRACSDRQSLEEFTPQLRRHIWAILNSQETLKQVKDVFDSAQRIWPATCSETIQIITNISEHGHRFHASIEDSIYLPLVVVPLRLSLLVTLRNIEHQIMKLNQLLIALSDKSKTALSQSVEDRYNIVREMDVLIRYSEQAIIQAEELLRKAHEREQEYTTV